MEEDKLGANMVNYVDEILAAADTTNAAILAQLNSGQPFEPLYKRIAPAFGEGATESDIKSSFGELIAGQFTKVSQGLAHPPMD